MKKLFILLSLCTLTNLANSMNMDTSGDEESKISHELFEPRKELDLRVLTWFNKNVYRLSDSSKIMLLKYIYYEMHCNNANLHTIKQTHKDSKEESLYLKKALKAQTHICKTDDAELLAEAIFDFNRTIKGVTSISKIPTEDSQLAKLFLDTRDLIMQYYSIVHITISNKKLLNKKIGIGFSYKFNLPAPIKIVFRKADAFL